ncbi:MAG: secretion protein HlyD [Polyangiaceae bacterium]|jgi:RND family efflux transporter MFP subunit|nr:secretion protein HlyD [Polyangiaceae bacterium]
MPRWTGGLAVSSKLFCIVGIFVWACAKPTADSEPAHPHDHGANAEETPSIAITRYSERYELFVEFSAPAPGQPVTYHAHVTRLSDFSPVTSGSLVVRFKNASGVAREAKQHDVKRPGVFVLEAPAPTAGRYALEMVYANGDQLDTFEGGDVAVQSPPLARPKPSGSAITFLKEVQWRVPFGTARAETRLMARELELPGVVEPAAGDQLTVGAPTGGRFFHSSKLALVEGTRIAKGDVLGAIAPNVAGDDFTRLQLAVEEGTLGVSQTERELARVEPLVGQGLLPEKRVIQLRNELETRSAQLRSARSRLARVSAPGGAGGLPIKSTQDGVIAEVVAANGEPVEPGAPLVRIGGTAHWWIRTRFVAKPVSLLAGAAPASLRLASGERTSLESHGARFVSALPVVDAATRVATWIVDVPSPASQSLPSDFRTGANVVVGVRVGKAETALGVPRSAVVEINTRPYVFVQVDGEQFEKRLVSVGAADGDYIRVEEGVKAGERIVTRGGYDIHLASLMETVQSHRH